MWIHLVTFRQALPFSNILEHFCSYENVGDALARLWFETGCTGGSRGRRRVALPCPGSCGVLPSWAESPFCPQPPEPDVPLHINSQFIVGFHWIWPQGSVQGGLCRPWWRHGSCRQCWKKAQGGKCFLYTTPKQPPPFSDKAKVKIFGTFPGTPENKMRALLFLWLRSLLPRC